MIVISLLFNVLSTYSINGIVDSNIGRTLMSVE